MKSLRDHESVRPSGSTGMDGENGEDRPGVVGNERLTALAGAVLLVLMVVELVTVANLRAGLSVHVLIGVLLAGPLAVKLGSTGYLCWLPLSSARIFWPKTAYASFMKPLSWTARRSSRCSARRFLPPSSCASVAS